VGNKPLPKDLKDGTEEKKVLWDDLSFLNDKIWIDSSAPVQKRLGQMWYNITNQKLYIWTGSNWKEILTQ